MIGLKEMASKPPVIRLGIFASQHIPKSIGRYFAFLISWTVCLFKPPIYRTTIWNLGQVLGHETDQHTLHITVRRLLYNTLRNYFYLFRSLKQPIDEIVNSVDVPAETQAILADLRNEKTGKIILSAHLGNFDLGGQVLAYYLQNFQCITIINPSPGFQLTNNLRERTGLIKVTPLSKAALSEAYRNLRKGGTVFMMADRIVSDLDKPVSFFGTEARMPSAHVRMALKTNAIIVIGCFVYSTETKKYTMHVESLYEVIHTGNHEEDLQKNMRLVLDRLERMIRRWPDQWQTFVPIWPKDRDTNT